MRGKGELISNILYPKYYFLIIQPSFTCSTKTMYDSFQQSDFDFNADLDLEEINDQDSGNDFEKLLNKTEPQFSKIMNYLNNLDDVIFSRLTGSGSCIFSVFQNKSEAEKAQSQFNQDFPNLWSHLAENNKVNLF